MIALIRTEFVKAARRTRSLVVLLALVGLPALIVVAINAGGPRRGGDGAGPSDGLFRLTQQSGLLVPAAVLTATSAFLLVVVAGTFAGDSVAGDAAWGNLRYLLMRPVARGRLLFAKAFVAGVLIWIATILVAVAGLVAGVILFGTHPIAVPEFGPIGANVIGGFRLGAQNLLARDAIATAYVAFSFTALLALGTFFSTLTDVTASAIGATIGTYIVSEILDAISQLGRVRYAFPTHYQDSWSSMFTNDTFSHDMIAGIVVQLVYLAVFGGAALYWFRRKDIRS